MKQAKKISKNLAFYCYMYNNELHDDDVTCMYRKMFDVLKETVQIFGYVVYIHYKRDNCFNGIDYYTVAKDGEILRYIEFDRFKNEICLNV